MDGSAQTAFSLPSYNPNADPLGLEYNSAVADPNPVFEVDYQLSATKSVPTSVTGLLTMTNQGGTNVYTGSTTYFSPSALNEGDTMDLALQASGLTMASGRYNWQIVVIANYSPTSTTTYTGSFNFINGSTTPTSGGSATASPFGAGWSLDDVYQLIPVTGGVILQNPDGTNLWYATSGTSYTSPPGDFSTLSLTSGVYTRTMPDGTKYEFNTLGLETDFVDRNTNTTTFAYSSSNQLTAVTDMNSQVSTITYYTSGASSGLAKTIADPDGRTVTLTYSSADLTSIVDPGGNTWTYGYDSSNRLTSLQDPRGTGYKTSFSYNYASEVTSVTQPAGTTESFAPQQLAGLPASGAGTSGSPAAAILAAQAFATYTDPNSKVWTEYADGLGFGLPVESIDPLGDTSLTFRNASGLPWMAADALGRRDRLFFDTHGDIVTFVYADESDWTATYNSFAEPTKVTDPTGGVTTYGYDVNGNLTSVEDPLSNSTEYVYYYNGLLEAVEDARYQVTTYLYDSLNRLTNVIDALGNTQTWAYDSYGHMTAYTDQNTYTTSYSYDLLGDLLTETVPDTTGVSSTYTYTYDAVGNLLTEVDPISSGVSATTTYAYNAMNRLTQTTDPLTHSTTYNHDNAGNLTGVVNALGYTTTYAFDAASRLTAVTVPLASGSSATTTYTLDADGEVAAVENAVSQTTTYVYNYRGWVIAVTNPLTDVTYYEYDKVGDVTIVLDTTSYGVTISTSASYETGALHLLSTTTDALGDVTTYSYDADNNLTAVTDYNSNTTDYSYDALDRLSSKSVNGVAATNYAYDGDGNVTSVTDPLSHVTTMTYDEQGRLLTDTNPLTATTTYHPGIYDNHRAPGAAAY